MMNVFCQYSLGGYKIFHFGKKGTSEVTPDSRFGLAPEVVSFLSRSGMKMILTLLPDNRWIYLLNDIPIDSTDEIGRSKQMSIAIIADKPADLPQLQAFVCMTIAGVPAVEQYLSSLVKDTDEGLSFDYTTFSASLKEIFADDKVNSSNLFERISRNASPVFMYCGIDFASSADAYGSLITSSMRRYAMKCRWDEAHRQSEIPRSNKILEFINRIISRLKIWKD